MIDDAGGLRTEDNLVRTLADLLLREMPQHRSMAASFGDDAAGRRLALRALMNLRPPLPLTDAYLEAEHRLLSMERERKRPVKPGDVPEAVPGSGIRLWRGDITRMEAGAIVNAANSEMLGCFRPLHGCVDNAIHSAAGLRLRGECANIMAELGRPARIGEAIATSGCELPAAHVIHVTGPVAVRPLPAFQRRQLAGCYASCLEAAERLGVESIAFCCISTGIFGFPRPEAARTAVGTVSRLLPSCRLLKNVVFTVFTDEDEQAYKSLLS